MGFLRTIANRLRLWNTEQVGRWLAGYDEDIGVMAGRFRAPSRPYDTTPWVHRAIEAVASATASIPIVITDLDGQLIEASPLYDLFGSPFAMYQRHCLIYQFVGQYLLTGEAHLIQGLWDPSSPSIDIFGAPSMKALTSKDGQTLLGWEVSVVTPQGTEKKTIDLDSIVSWIDPQLYPGTKFRGLSRLRALTLPMIEDQKSAEHNAVLLSRGGGPRGFLKTEQTLTPEQAQQLEERFEAKYVGSENVGKTAVLGKGTEWKTMAQTNRELLLMDNRKVTRETILSLFDVPPAVVGLYVDSNRAHDESAREGFWVHTISLIADQVGELLTRAFVPRLATSEYTQTGMRLGWNPYFRRAARIQRGGRKGNPYNIMIWLDLGQVPALRRWHSSQADNAFKWTQAGVPLNQIIEKCDLPFEKVPWGDEWWAPINVAPTALLLEKLKTDIEVAKRPPPSPTGGSGKPPAKSLSPEDKERVWRKWVASWAGLEVKTAKVLKAYFFRQRKEMLQRLDQLGVAPKGVLPGERKSIQDQILFDSILENNLLLELITPYFKAGYVIGGQQMMRETEGTINPFSIPDPTWDKFLPERFAHVANINQTTAKQLSETFDEAFRNNETVQDISGRIKDVYRAATDVRALSIARTESGMSVSSGRFETAKQNAVGYKGWLDSMDEHTRDSHREAGNKYSDMGIPIDEPFQLRGGNLEFPCDPAGPASEVVNCRCVMIPLEAPGAKAFAECIGKYASPDFQFERWSDDHAK